MGPVEQCTRNIDNRTRTYDDLFSGTTRPSPKAGGAGCGRSGLYIGTLSAEELSSFYAEGIIYIIRDRACALRKAFMLVALRCRCVLWV